MDADRRTEAGREGAPGAEGGAGQGRGLAGQGACAPPARAGARAKGAPLALLARAWRGAPGKPAPGKPAPGKEAPVADAARHDHAGEAMRETEAASGERAAIEARGLGRRFGRRWVVRDLDFAVPEGSITALLGRNGQGKSTTIQMLLGLLPPSAGSVSVLGRDPRRQGHRLFEDVAFVSERRELLDDLSVAALAALVAEAHGARFDRDGFERQRAAYRLDPGVRCAHLSKGQRARLLLALALAARPRLLVLDEPTSGLDPLVRDDFLEGIAAFVADAPGRAVLLSTHGVEDVARIADRAVVLRDGAPALVGELERLRAACGVYVVELAGVLPPGDALPLPRGAVVLERDPRALTLVAHGPAEHVEAELDRALPVAAIERRRATVKEAFACWTEPQAGRPGAGAPAGEVTS